MQMLVLSEKVPRGMEEVTLNKILRYAMAFESEFDKIHVIASYDYRAESDIPEKLSFHKAKWRETKSNMLGIFFHLLYMANVFHTVFKILKEDNSITVVTNSWGHCTLGLLAVVAAKITHRKSIVRVTGSLEVGNITFKRRYGIPINPILAILEKAAFNHSDLIISVSESIFETHPKIRKKTFIIPDLFPVIDEFAEDKSCQEKKSNTGEIKILYIGRLEPEKGVDILLGTLKSMQLFCKIVGDGSLRKELEERAKKLGISDRVTFTGHLPQKEAYNLICASDILVLPSFTEFTPNVIIEAMGIGTLVVASDVGGIKYIIKNGENGFTFKKGSIEDLTKVLTKVINDPKMRTKVCGNAKKQVYEGFSTQSIRDKAKQAVMKLQF